MIKITEEWDKILEQEFSSPSYLKLRQFLKEEYSTRTIYPSMYDIFSSMKHTSFSNVKVVLLGQDPYHEKGQAMGLSFSVPEGVKIPPSLVNIFKEIHAEYGVPPAKSGDLTGWAKQGVLLLNTVLTVREHQANSHSTYGWQRFTDRIIEEVSKQDKPVVFLLWGRNAINKKPLIDESKHLVLTSAHPSPLSAYNGFFGNGHFKKTNEFLKAHGRGEINWKIENIEK